MHVLVEGSGGSSGWPQPGCRCASCLRCWTDGNIRKRSTIVVDDAWRMGGDGPERLGGDGPERLGGDGPERMGGAWAGGLVNGYRVEAIAGGWDVTSADGERLLYPAGPGTAADPPEGTAPYDVAFLDLLGDPAQLGRLRARGLIRADTITVVAFADHRVTSAAELEQRSRFWRVSVLGDGDAITTDRSARENGDAGIRRAPWRVLVMGGARSGKSERAELRLAGEPDVTYVATGPRPGGTGDPDWTARVAAHRARRPGWWRTAETTDLAGVLGSTRGAVLIDGIGTWLAAVLDECDAWDGADGADGPGGKVADRAAELVAVWRQTEAYVVAVSDETGMGVVPATAAGRLFRDRLGRLNQALAAESEEAELVIAGRVVPLGTW